MTDNAARLHAALPTTDISLILPFAQDKGYKGASSAYVFFGKVRLQGLPLYQQLVSRLACASSLRLDFMLTDP